MKWARIDPKKAARLYLSGLTQREVADALGASVTAIGLLMKRHSISVRPNYRQLMKVRKGPANPGWKGEAVTYRSAHARVERERGKPQHCKDCGTTDPAKDYEWANLSGKYHDPRDYVRLCRSCHRRRDRTRPRKSIGAAMKALAATRERDTKGRFA